MSLKSVVEAALQGILRKDPEPMVSMFADDGALLMMLEPGGPRRVEGKAAIASAMAAVGAVAEIYPVETPRLFADEAAGVAGFEVKGRLRAEPDGPLQEITQAVFVEFRDGKAIAWRDYRSTTAIEEGR